MSLLDEIRERNEKAKEECAEKCSPSARCITAADDIDALLAEIERLKKAQRDTTDSVVAPAWYMP